MRKVLDLDDQDSGKRLDEVVSRHLSDGSRSYWAKAIASGQVIVNDDTKKTGYRVKGEDKIVIDIPQSTSKPIDIPVIYEDDEVIVIDKPAGVLVHKNSNFNTEFTVVDFMRDKYMGNDERGGIVHRLDRTTSGVMICAKNDRVATRLQLEFSERNVLKKYLAICTGKAKEKEAIIDLPIERNPKKPNTFRVGANGKESITRYKIIKKLPKSVLVELFPKTGRTHQLRVHMAYAGLPIVGDIMYGGISASRAMLHSTELTIDLPGAGKRTFISPTPKSFKYE